MLFVDTNGELIEIVKRPPVGSHFDYLWTAQYVNKRAMRFSFDSGEIGTEYIPVTQISMNLVIAA